MRWLSWGGCRGKRRGETMAWDAGHAFRANGTLAAWTKVIDGADVVINLAGRSVDCRYTKANRAAILRSLASGFEFTFPSWAPAAVDLVRAFRGHSRTLSEL